MKNLIKYDESNPADMERKKRNDAAMELLERLLKEYAAIDAHVSSSQQPPK